MPRFFFHVRREGWNLDPVTEVLPEASAALATARGVARELLADPDGGWASARIEVADERGDLVGVIQMSDYWLQ